MKSKTLRLISWLLMLATLPLCAQSGTELKQTSGNDYGIDSERTYSGSEVQELIRIVTEEAESSIDIAFAEGYKQGLLEAAPEAEYWKVVAKNAETKTVRYKKERWLFALGGLGAGIGISVTIRLAN